MELRKYKIVFVGGFGACDAGDDAMLSTVLMNFKKIIPNAQFSILSEDPECNAEYHKDNQVEISYSIEHYLLPKRRNLSKKSIFKVSIVRKFYIFFNFLFNGLILLINAWGFKNNKKAIFLNIEGEKILSGLKGADIIFNVGGSYFNSVMRNELYGKGLTCLISKIFGKPVILSGQTIGPLTNWVDKKFANFVLNKVDIITLRDAESKTVLEDINVTLPIIKVTVDDAMLLPSVSQKDIDKIFLHEKISKRYPLVIMNTLNYEPISSEKLERSKKILAQAADYFITKRGAKVIFIPMQQGKGYEDMVAHSEIVKLMRNKDEVKIITNMYNGRTSKGIIAQADLVIGSRYHFIVFSTSSAVPSIGLYFDDYYAMKIRGILKLMGQEKYACNITTVASSTEIIKLAEDLLLNKDKIIKELKTRTKILQKHSLLSIKYAKKLLEETSRLKNYDV